MKNVIFITTVMGLFFFISATSPSFPDDGSGGHVPATKQVESSKAEINEIKEELSFCDFEKDLVEDCSEAPECNAWISCEGACDLNEDCQLGCIFAYEEAVLDAGRVYCEYDMCGGFCTGDCRD